MKNNINEERAQILPKIERSEEELRQAVGELQIAVKRGVDPREWIVERPFLWLVGSLLIGFWFGYRRASRI
jgi:hypothetical protein